MHHWRAVGREWGKRRRRRGQNEAKQQQNKIRRAV
jgi:hypothetical protein